MSGGLAPSKSTVYVGNLPFSLTNNDLHKVFDKFGKIAKVTILRDKVTRTSKGVAFIQFVDRDSANDCCKSVNEKILFERKIKCVIAKDNGRATEFIRKKEYPDKSSCYECGEEGHLSYECPKNILGNREPPPKKEKKTKKQRIAEKEHSMSLIKSYYNDDDNAGEDGHQNNDEVGEDPYESSLSYAIALESNHNTQNDLKRSISPTPSTSTSGETAIKRKKFRPSSYFSDEEEVDD